MEKVIFVETSKNEVKFNYKDHKFLLLEKHRGVCSAGRAIQLYELNGLEKKHIKEIGWTSWDGNRSSENAVIQKLTNMDECKTAAIKYIDDLLK